MDWLLGNKPVWPKNRTRNPAPAQVSMHTGWLSMKERTLESLKHHKLLYRLFLFLPLGWKPYSSPQESLRDFWGPHGDWGGPKRLRHAFFQTERPTIHSTCKSQKKHENCGHLLKLTHAPQPNSRSQFQVAKTMTSSYSWYNYLVGSIVKWNNKVLHQTSLLMLFFKPSFPLEPPVYHPTQRVSWGGSLHRPRADEHTLEHPRPPTCNGGSGLRRT